MRKKISLTSIVSICLVGLGIVSLALNLIFGWTVNFGWPILIIFLGWALYLLASYLIKDWNWADLLYIPSAFLLSIGFIFLLNVITNDWKAWAYAWMLLISGLAFGVVLANQSSHWPRRVSQISVGVSIAGIACCTLFGILVGGRFFLVMASVLLVLGGIGLYWLRPKLALRSGLMQKNTDPGVVNEISQPVIADRADLAEALSARELEVLRLIDQGLTNPVIAERLNLAPSTVKTHINNIFSKMGVQTRVQALNRAKELGLLP